MLQKLLAEKAEVKKTAPDIWRALAATLVT